MNPTRVFISIFAAGIILAVLLGVVGLNQDQTAEEAEEGAPEGEEGGIVLDDIPASMNQCLACHGDNLEGASGPELQDVQLSADDIIDILQNGQGAMPPQELSEEEMQEVADYLVNLDVGEQEVDGAGEENGGEEEGDE